MFYYLISNLFKKYYSGLDMINLFVVVRFENVLIYGFDMIFEFLLYDLKKFIVSVGYLIYLKDGKIIFIRVFLVVYVVDNLVVY